MLPAQTQPTLLSPLSLSTIRLHSYSSLYPIFNSESCRRVISKSLDDSDENAVHNRWYMLNVDMQGLRSEPLRDLALTKLLQQETLFYSDVCIAAGFVFFTFCIYAREKYQKLIINCNILLGSIVLENIDSKT